MPEWRELSCAGGYSGLAFRKSGTSLVLGEEEGMEACAPSKNNSIYEKGMDV